MVADESVTQTETDNWRAKGLNIDKLKLLKFDNKLNNWELPKLKWNGTRYVCQFVYFEFILNLS